MAEFVTCATCAALTLPGEDAKVHAADHLHMDRRLTALGRENAKYLTDIASLKDQIKAYGRQLDAHPISMDPETITVSAAPTFDNEDLDEYIDDEPDDAISEETVDAYANAVDAMAQPTEPEYPLAIDRPAESTDAMSGLYTPRNLIG